MTNTVLEWPTTTQIIKILTRKKFTSVLFARVFLSTSHVPFLPKLISSFYTIIFLPRVPISATKTKPLYNVPNFSQNQTIYILKVEAFPVKSEVLKKSNAAGNWLLLINRHVEKHVAFDICPANNTVSFPGDTSF
jgi:hypothetical protein